MTPCLNDRVHMLSLIKGVVMLVLTMRLLQEK